MVRSQSPFSTGCQGDENQGVGSLLRDMLKLRLIYLTLIPITVVAAFATRFGMPWIPGFVAEYGGDTLWALMVFMVLRVIAPRQSPVRAATIALTISYLCELSQLYHAPWIEAIRSYRLGGLLLGYGFLWSDLVCYTVGVLAGTMIEIALRQQKVHQIYSAGG
jgi:hypothetical protein